MRTKSTPGGSADDPASQSTRPRMVLASGTGEPGLHGTAGPGREISHVRVLVVDASGALLVMKWRDPADGRTCWEPPGGGVELGESLAEAAERELREETGITARVTGRWAPARRDDTWEGARRDRDEAFFLARVTGATVRPEMPTAEERATLVAWRWVTLTGPAGLDRLDAPLFPPDPFVLARRIG